MRSSEILGSKLRKHWCTMQQNLAFCMSPKHLWRNVLCCLPWQQKISENLLKKEPCYQWRKMMWQPIWLELCGIKGEKMCLALRSMQVSKWINLTAMGYSKTWVSCCQKIVITKSRLKEYIFMKYYDHQFSKSILQTKWLMSEYRSFCIPKWGNLVCLLWATWYIEILETYLQSK